MMKNTGARMTPTLAIIVLAVAAIAAGQQRTDRGRGGDARGPKRPDSPSIRVETITDEGGRLDWSGARNLIAFDRLARRQFLDVYTMKPDGSNQTCLTCDKSGAPAKHMGNPAWHPSGDYLAFQAQNTYKSIFGRFADYFANPGAGINNDVWIMDYPTRHFWQLTHVEGGQGGVLHPHFSRAGDKLLWAERVSARGGKWGTWTLRVANFSIANGIPRITNERTFQPGAQHKMYESHDFSPDGQQILFSGNLEPGQDESLADIYLLDLSSGKVKNLTNSPDDADEHAHFSPDGRTIVWMTSTGQKSKPSMFHPVNDLWLMDADGSNKRRLTYFNEPGHAEYIKGGVAPADNAWSPDGTRIAAYVLTDVRRGGKIVIIDLRSDRSSAAAVRELPLDAPER